jgi:hypothetical protein
VGNERRFAAAIPSTKRAITRIERGGPVFQIVPSQPCEVLTTRGESRCRETMSRFIFPEWTETLKKWVNLLVLGAPVYLVALIVYGVSPEALRIGYQPDQPVPYSHALHAGELGIDCRYCHSVVEHSPKAAVPPAGVCMNCHSTVRKDSDALLPIRQAFAENQPVHWTRVTD